MAEFIGTEEKVVNVGEPVIFENNTDSDFEISAGIVFRKSGLYDVSIVGRRTIVSKAAERPKGEWIKVNPHIMICPFCKHASSPKNFCADCGADMRGKQDE